MAKSTPEIDPSEQAARWFHEIYEKLAPGFGYETRPESAVPWEQVPHRELMIATAGIVRTRIEAPLREEIDRLEEALLEAALDA